MTTTEFIPNELIAGFSLIKIKGLLLRFIANDQVDIIAKVADELGCPGSQAKSVVEQLDARGLIEGDGERWSLTSRGRDLAFRWHPPREYRPAIEREDERGVYGEIYEQVPCSLLRVMPDDAHVFEEAALEVGVTVSYDDDRLVEINVVQPDDYEDTESGGLMELSAYVTVAGAKALAEGLQAAIARAERELVRLERKLARGAAHLAEEGAAKRRARKKRRGGTQR